MNLSLILAISDKWLIIGGIGFFLLVVAIIIYINRRSATHEDKGPLGST